MQNLVEELEIKLSYLFQEFKPLKYSSKEVDRLSFLVKLRLGDDINKMREVIQSMKSDIKISDVKSFTKGHKFTYKECEIVINYIPHGSSFDFFYNMSNYCLNSFLGKIVKRFDLKLTHSGLFYEEKLTIENHQSKVGDFLITDSVEKLLGFLGLNYQRFKDGFQTKEEFFNFLLESPFINTKIFSHPKKEHDFQLFIDFQNFLLENSIEKIGDKKTLSDIESYFDDVKFFEKIETLKEKERRKREAVFNFNGRLILDYFPDFDKNKLGTSMAYFKFSFGDVEKYRDFLLNNNSYSLM